MKVVTYMPAECMPGCEDPECPYIHSEAWWAGGEGPFNSEAEAIASLAIPSPPPSPKEERYLAASEAIRKGKT